MKLSLTKRVGFSTSVIAMSAMMSAGAFAQTIEERMAAAERIIDEVFPRSTLSREEQLEEMRFFIEASEPYRGMSINTVAESLPTHVFESTVMAEAFEELTGISVEHSIIQEGDLVEQMQTEMPTRISAIVEKNAAVGRVHTIQSIIVNFLSNSTQREAARQIVANEIDDQSAWDQCQHTGRSQHSPINTRGRDRACHHHRNGPRIDGCECARQQQLDPGKHEAKEHCHPDP